MSYLIFEDFKRSIQSDNLKQVIGQDLTLVDKVSNLAVEEATSYLKPKYNTSEEFTDTPSYNPAKAYNAGSRVYLTANTYSATNLYQLYVLTLYNSNVYVCTSTIATPEAFNPDHWTLLGAQYSMYYVPYPKPVFDYLSVYEVGDMVFWKNKIYTCAIATTGISYDTKIQINVSTTPNYTNIFPDDKVNGAAYWGAGVPYSVDQSTLYAGAANLYAPSYSQTLQIQYTAATDGESFISIPTLVGKTIIQIVLDIKPLLTSLYSYNENDEILTLNGFSIYTGQTLFILYTTFIEPLESAVWLLGDNRSQQMVTYLIDISLYHIHSRIAPNNIPELRVKRYDDAIAWLKKSAKGDITANITVNQPIQGRRIRYNSNQKQNNGY